MLKVIHTAFTVACAPNVFLFVTGKGGTVA